MSYSLSILGSWVDCKRPVDEDEMRSGIDFSSMPTHNDESSGPLPANAMSPLCRVVSVGDRIDNDG